MDKEKVEELFGRIYNVASRAQSYVRILMASKVSEQVSLVDKQKKTLTKEIESAAAELRSLLDELDKALAA